MLNMMGEPVKSPPSIIVSRKRSDRVWNLISEKGAFIPVPSRQTKMMDGTTERYMLPTEFYDYIKMSGQDVRQRIERNYDVLNKMDKATAQKWVAKQTQVSRKIAKATLQRQARTAQ